MRIAGVLACLLCGPMARQATASPTIDGFLADPFWSLHARVWTARDPRLPHNAARFYLACDENYLYFAADVTDANVAGDHRKQRDEVWGDDAAQVFLDFGDGSAAERTPETFAYGFSAAGGASWTRGTGDGSGADYPAHDWPPAWNSAVEWAVALKTGTTLNYSGDRDTGYVVEARIPWSELGQKMPFQPDRTIGVSFLNFCRPERAVIGNQPLATLPNIDLSNSEAPRLWQRVRTNWQGPLAIRGVVGPLPLWLGTSLYNNEWKRFEPAETDPAGPWFNRPRWTGKLDRMASQQLNALLLTHPHPFPGLLALKGYPGACYFPREQLDQHVAQFKWLLAEAKRRGVRVYLMIWNICLPPKWAESQGLHELGADTPLSRAYTSRAVIDLLSTYPDLGGLVTLAGENPPGCVDFVADAIAGAMNRAGATTTTRHAEDDPSALPELIFWTWCSYPEDARRVLDACPRTRLMHYLQCEQWFKPMVDPRVPRFEAFTAAVQSHTRNPAISTIVLGGPKSSLAYLLWGDPEWIRTLALDLRREGAHGIFFEPYCADAWLATEALAVYSFSTGQRFNPRRWAKRLDEMYGVGEYAPQLLETIQHASAIVPRFVTLVHSQSDHYMPQFGLPLTHYLEMPTLSSYVFENTQTLDDRGYLTPRLGMTWPNPDWGERIAGIREAVLNPASAGFTRPKAIADEINLHVITCQSRLGGLKAVKPAHPDQARRLTRLLDRIELNVALGEHLSQKIKAAIGWQSFQAGRGRSIDCIRPLRQSVKAWETVVEVADRLYPEPVRYWQSQIVSVPPWTQNQIWGSYRLIEGHWRDQSPRFERELNLVRQSLSTGGPGASLPLWDMLDAEPADSLLSLGRIGFEIDLERDLRIKIGDGAALTADADLVLGGAKSLLADTRRLDGGAHVVVSTDPGHAPMLGHRPYRISLAYRVIERGSGTPAPFEIGVRPAGGGEPLGDHRFWGAPNGHIGTRILKVPPLKRDDYVFFIAVHGQAAIVVDQIDVQTLKAY